MKAKLIKYDYGYGLGGCELIAFVSKNRPTHKHYKLSLKNCQAIERGYDLNELAKNYAEEENDCYVNDYNGFKQGFRKALQILGDNKFSKEDVKKAYMIGWNSCNNFNGNDESKEFIESPGCIQSLQQTEWDVDIVMEINLNGKNGLDRAKMIPKLDPDGCLILKRI